MTLVFTRSRSWLSRLIRWATRGQVSHVAIGTELAGVPVVVEADALGVVVTLRTRFAARSEIVAEYKVIDGMLTVGGAVDEIGHAYDYSGLFGMAVVTVARYFGRKIRNPFQSPRAFFCSELVFAIDPLRTVVPWRSMRPDTTSPQDLYDACRMWPTVFVEMK
jgi:hypothetical protein